MDITPYHHGNLRNELIEAGIELINQEGIDKFSIRKVAMKCKVSHAAPYNHFKDKDELLYEMKNYVITKFTDSLTKVINEDQNNRNRDNSFIMVDLGIAYVNFFIENPQYYSFIFSQGDFLRLKITDESIEQTDFPPFELFRNTAEHGIKKASIKPGSYSSNMIAMWAAVHGLAAIFTNKSVQYQGDRTAFIKRILSDNFIIK